MTKEGTLAIAARAVLEAGSLVKDGFNHEVKPKVKSKHDIVTAIDIQAEGRIIEILTSAFPDFSIQSEEAGFFDQDSDYCWVIDPLDGTSNFATGNPYFTISVALAHHNTIQLGAVYSPISEELFHAQRGEGAFLNGKPIHVSKRNRLSNSMIATAFSSEDDKIVEGISLIKNLSLNCRRVVINFAPAYDLCNIARGRLDGLVDNGSTPEDHAAGSLILEEAGGQLRNWNHSGWDFNTLGIVATNAHLNLALSNHLKKL